MNTLTFLINGNRLKQVGGYEPISGEKKYSILRFEFDSEWEDVDAVTVVQFFDPENTKAVVGQIENGVAVVRIHEELRNLSGKMWVGVVGTKIGDSGVTIDTNLVPIPVGEGTRIDGTESTALYLQLIEYIGKLYEFPSDRIADGAVKDEKLERPYWELTSATVYDFSYLDSIIEDRDTRSVLKTLYRIKFDSLFPDRDKTVGDSEYVAVLTSKKSELLLINLSNGDVWTYEKGSNALVEKKITSSMIAPGAIVGENIGLQAIGHNNLAPNSVRSYHIMPSSIGHDHIDVDSIDKEQIRKGAVTEGKLHRTYCEHTSVTLYDFSYLDSLLEDTDTRSVLKTIYKIEFDSTFPDRDTTVGEYEYVGVANTDRTKLLLMNLTNGDAWTYEKGSNTLVEKKITSSMIAPGAVIGGKLGQYAVDEDAIKPGAVTENKLQKGAVTEDKIADGAVHSNHLTDACIRSKHIEDNAVTAEKLAFGVIDSTDKFSDDFVSHYLSLPVTKVSASGIFTDSFYGSRTTPGIYQLDSHSGTHQVLVVLKPDSDSHLMQLRMSVDKVEYRGIWCTEDGVYAEEDWTPWQTFDFSASIVDISHIATELILESNMDYRLSRIEGVVGLTLKLPDSMPDDFECSLVFRSGDDTATSITCPSFIKWSGEDVESVTTTENGAEVTYNCLVPKANKTYNVIFWYDGFNVNAVSRGVTNG